MKETTMSFNLRFPIVPKIPVELAIGKKSDNLVSQNCGPTIPVNRSIRTDPMSPSVGFPFNLNIISPVECVIAMYESHDAKGTG